MFATSQFRKVNFVASMEKKIQVYIFSACDSPSLKYGYVDSILTAPRWSMSGVLLSKAAKTVYW